MLASHRYRFIFIKTLKTAGTSVEAYFEPYCMPEGEWSFSHHRETYASDAGIVGFRGPNNPKVGYYNHMPAWKIRSMVGEETWDDYFKFTVVRNPYDKLISSFYMREAKKAKYTPIRKLKALRNLMFQCGNPIDRIGSGDAIERFRKWVRIGGKVVDSDLILIDQKECVDDYIQFESLHDGVRSVCGKLGIPFDEDRLPRLKGGYRKGSIPVRDYYDDASIEIVKRLYRWEIDRFGYKLPEGSGA